jgi:YebC/PmpR family DNA-binding regulatory protein
MSGHSKWSTIKRKKGANDAKRGKMFTKLIREITVAARDGGADENSNIRLRTAVQNARAANMPLSTVERAIKRGSGQEEGTSFEEGLYEGYGPGGVAIMVETLTDNKNRTVSEVRHIFSKHGGNLAETGAVSWMFEQKGTLEVNKIEINSDDLLMLVLDAGAEDIQDGEEVHELVTTVSAFGDVKKVLEIKEIGFGQASLSWIPKGENLLEVEVDQVSKIIRLLESLEDLDDVQNVYSNFDLNEDVLDAVVTLQ